MSIGAWLVDSQATARASRTVAGRSHATTSRILGQREQRETTRVGVVLFFEVFIERPGAGIGGGGIIREDEETGGKEGQGDIVHWR